MTDKQYVIYFPNTGTYLTRKEGSPGELADANIYNEIQLAFLHEEEIHRPMISKRNWILELNDAEVWEVMRS